jgi:putative transposase
MHGKETPLGILSLERLFRQLENWGQDSEDSRFGDLSGLVTQNLKWVLEESFEWEARHKTGCSLYARSDTREDYRNGYRTRDILTRFGKLEDVKVPRLRHSGFVPSILAPGRLALPDVEELVAKCLLCGASRREIIEMLTLVLGYPPCGSLLARVQSQLDRQADAFRNRDLTKTYKYLFVDGICVKIKDGRFAKDSMVLIAVGIDNKGFKEVIGYTRSKRESGTAWRRLLNQLVERGLDYGKLDLVISDDSSAIALAVDDVFGDDVVHQLCWAHRMARLADVVDEENRGQCVDGLRQVYRAKNRATALKAYRVWVSKWAHKYVGFAAELEKDLGKLLSFFSCPKSHWQYIRTNNPIERLNEDIRSRSYGWAGFQNRESCYRLLYGLFQQRNNDWKEIPKLDFTHWN